MFSYVGENANLNLSFFESEWWYLKEMCEVVLWTNNNFPYCYFRLLEEQLVLLVVAPDVLLSIWEHWLFNFPFTVILKWLSGKGALALVFYFKFPDEIGPDQYALILFSVLSCHEVPQTYRRHVSLHLEYVVSSGMASKIWKFWDKIGFLSYLCGSEVFCTVTCYFLWDAEQTSGIIIIPGFWVGFFSYETVELLGTCNFLISSFYNLR